VTSLRTFEPLEAFPPIQRRALAAYLADPRAGREADEVEQLAAWRRLLGRTEAEPALHARVLRVDGAVLLCPLPAEPSTGAFLADGLRPSGPGASGDWGGEAAGESVGDLGRGRSVGEAGALGAVEAPPAGGASNDSVPPRRHSLVRAWDLPVSWLAIVRKEDLTSSGGLGRYVLPMSRARARAARSLRTLRTHLGDLDVTADAEGLARWLEVFHPRSWVEVDARPVAALVGGDDGAEDVRLGLESLTAGDTVAVAAAYQRLRRRSRRLDEASVSS
jgi:hypothetical protein